MSVRAFFADRVDTIFRNGEHSSSALDNNTTSVIASEPSFLENDSSGIWCNLKFAGTSSEVLINKISIHISQFVDLHESISKSNSNVPWSRNLSYNQDRIYNILKQYCFQRFISELQKDKVIVYYPQGCNDPSTLIYNLEMKNNSCQNLYGIIKKQSISKSLYTKFSFITENQVPKITVDAKEQSKYFDYITSFRHWSGGAHCRRLLPYARSPTEIVDLIRQSEKYWLSHPECEVPFIFRDSYNLSRNYPSVLLPLFFFKATNSKCDAIIIASIIFETYMQQGQMVYQLRSILDLQSAWLNTLISNGIDCIRSHPQWEWVIPKDDDDEGLKFLADNIMLRNNNSPTNQGLMLERSTEKKDAEKKDSDQKTKMTKPESPKESIDSKGMVHGKIISVNHNKCEIISDAGIIYIGNTNSKFTLGNRVVFYPGNNQEKRALLIRLEI